MSCKRFMFVMCSVLVLSGCSGARESLGLNKSAPDEFKVLKRAPLALPPDYALRPPRPGAPRPQEMDTASQAAQTVFGGEPQGQQQTASDAGDILLQQAGARQADPSIRAKIDSETQELNETNKTVSQKILGISGLGGDEDSASVVDAQKEAERLKANSEAGKPVNAGDVPTIEE